MDVEVDFEDRGRYLVARIRGEKTFESLIDAIEKIAATCREHDRYKVLIDACDFRGKLQTLETYELVVDRMEAFRSLGTMEVVILDRGGSSNQFFENLVMNRGWMIRVVTEEEEGVRWLTR